MSRGGGTPAIKDMAPVMSTEGSQMRQRGGKMKRCLWKGCALNGIRVKVRVGVDAGAIVVGAVTVRAKEARVVVARAGAIGAGVARAAVAKALFGRALSGRSGNDRKPDDVQYAISGKSAYVSDYQGMLWYNHDKSVYDFFTRWIVIIDRPPSDDIEVGSCLLLSLLAHCFVVNLVTSSGAAM